MNKQEAIEKIKEEWFSGVVTSLRAITDIVNQIDEPQKPVVPKFVAEWIDEIRKGGYSLCTAFDLVDENIKTFDWLFNGYNTNQDIFARAWLDGYEVEKEKLYTVEIPDPNSYCAYRYLSRNDNGICIDASNNPKWKQNKKNHLTESEIKQDFEWAWQWANEVE